MFFGIDWFTAFMKISFNVVFSIVTAIPLVFSWNCVAPKYLYFLPEVYHHIPFWHVVAILLVARFVGEMINQLTPHFVSVNQNVKQ